MYPSKPTAIKKLEGNRGHQKLPEDEPEFEATIPEPPDDLSRLAKKYWIEISETLFKGKVLTGADKQGLRVLCETYADWVTLTKKINKDGLITLNAIGVPTINPLVRAADNKFTLLHKMLCEFGMTPASRTKVKTAKIDRNGDKAKNARFFDS